MTDMALIALSISNLAAFFLLYNANKAVLDARRFARKTSVEKVDLQVKVAAIERGRDEQEENYEQQFLSLQETVESLTNSNRALLEENAVLRDRPESW